MMNFLTLNPWSSTPLHLPPLPDVAAVDEHPQACEEPQELHPWVRLAGPPPSTNRHEHQIRTGPHPSTH